MLFRAMKSEKSLNVARSARFRALLSWTGVLWLACLSDSTLLGQTVISTTTTYNAQVLGFTGTLKVDGNPVPELFLINGTTLNAGVTSLTVGDTLGGAMTLTGGASVMSNTGYLGYSSGVAGAVKISDLGSQWLMTHDLYVGNSGSGALTITDRGKIVSAGGFLGFDQGSVGSATIHGNGSIWSMTNALYLGLSGQGSLTIAQEGAVISQTGYLGVDTGAIGAATIEGSGSLWTVTSGLYIGAMGNATLTVTDGGSVTSASAYLGNSLGITGTALISGANSLFNVSDSLYVGFVGGGALTVTDGGKLASNIGYVGNGAGSNGIVLVSGANSLWTLTNALFINYGTLTVTQGGSLVSDGGYFEPNGNVVVSGAGSNWTSSKEIYIGGGSLTLTNGGTVISSTGYVEGNQAAVFGLDSRWTITNGLYLGVFADGSLSITESGSVVSREGLLGANPGATGTAVVSGVGSRWTVTEGFYIGGSAATIGGAGSLNVNGGSVNVGGLTRVWSTGTLTIGPAGQVSTGSLVGDVINNGNLQIGADNSSSTFADTIAGSGSLTKVGTGTLTLNDSNTYGGATIVSAGALRIDNSLAGTSAVDVNAGGTFVVSASGTVSTAGTISVDGSAVLTNPVNSPGVAIVNGTVTADAIQVGQGGVLQGRGVAIAEVSVASGGGINPGNNNVDVLSVGNLALNGGAVLYFDFFDVDIVSGWDRIDVQNNLLDLGNATAANPIQIRIDALTANNLAHDSGGGGNNFDPTASYNWLFIESSNLSYDMLVSDSLASRFVFVDDANGAGVFGTGNAFSRSPQYAFSAVFGNFDGQGPGLYISYSAVPEPGSMLLTGLASLAGIAYRRRRLRQD